LGLVVALLLCAPSAAHAQVDDDTKPFTPFRITVVDGILNTTMPFDVKFIVWGDVPENTTDVTFEIRRVNEDVACPASGQLVQSTLSKPRRWTQRDYETHDVTDATAELTKKDLQFEVVVRELDPNSFYCFTIVLAPGRPLTLSEARMFRETLLGPYRTFLRGLGELSLTILRRQVEPLRQRLIAALLMEAEARGLRITPVPGSPFDPNSTSAAIQQLFLEDIAPVIDADQDVVDGLENFNNSGRNQMVETWLQAVRTAANDTSVPPAQRTLFNSLAPGTPARAATNILGGLPLNDNRADVTLEYEQVWDVSPVPPPPATGIYSPDTQCPTQGAVADRCRRLDEFRDLAARIDATGRINSTVKGFLDTQKSELLQIQSRVNGREDAIRNHLARFDALIRQSFNILATTNGNASTRRAWYVSADSGIAVAPSLGEVFPYIGSTMFFRPVNKAVPPSSFGTRFSVLFGFTWTNNVLKPGQRLALFAGDTTMLLGAGLRLTEYLRVTGGGVVFKAVDPNPLIDKTRLRLTPFISMSADIDAADVLKNLFGGQLNPPASGRVLDTPK
jgi:hypothetical protein